MAATALGCFAAAAAALNLIGSIVYGAKRNVEKSDRLEMLAIGWLILAAVLFK